MTLKDVIFKAKENGEHIVIAYETTYARTFKSFSRVDATWTKDTHAYEVLGLHHGVYFYVDIDEQVVIEDIVERITQCAREMFGMTPHFQIATSSKGNTHSYHIVTDVALQSITDAGSFAYMLHRPEIDMCVYKAHQNWRMLYQSKAKDSSRPFVPYGPYSRSITDHMIGVYDESIHMSRVTSVPTVVREHGHSIIDYLDTTLTSTPDSTSETPLRYILSCIPNEGHGQPWIVWLYVGFALRNMGADVGEWITWSNTWSNGDQTATCREIWRNITPRDDGFHFGTLIRCANQYTKHDVIRDFTRAELETIHGVERIDHTYSDTYVQPYVFPEHTRCFLERSNMGTGKTYQLFTYIATHAPARIVHLSARQDYTTSIHGEYTARGIRMHNYLRDGTDTADRMIIQMESLWRLEDQPPYDLVVLDEIESLLKQWSSTNTMKRRVAQNAGVFEHILTHATHIIGMDAFLSEKSVRCCTQMGLTPFVRWNTYQPYTRTAIDCETKQRLLSRLIHCVREGNKCVLFTSSQRFGLDVSCTLRREFPDIAMRYYHSGADDTLRLELQHVSDVWRTLDVLIYSPCITVGINFDAPHFDTLFLYGSCMSTNVRDCFQSSMRVRQVASQRCYYAIHTKSNVKVPTSKDAIMRHIGENVPLYGSSHSCPRWLLGVHVDNVREDYFHMTYYKDTWAYFLGACGYAVVSDTIVDECSLTSGEHVTYMDTPSCDSTAVLEEAIHSRTASAHVKHMFVKHVFDINGYTAQRDTPVVQRGYAFDAFYAHTGKRKVLKNVTDELYSTPRHIAETELRHASFVEIAATHGRTSAFERVCALVNDINVEHTRDSCTWFDVKEKGRASRTINEWSGGTIVKAKNETFRIKKKQCI